MGLQSLHDKAKPLEMQVSFTITEMQVFGGSLDEKCSVFMHVSRTLVWKIHPTSVAQ